MVCIPIIIKHKYILLDNGELLFLGMWRK